MKVKVFLCILLGLSCFSVVGQSLSASDITIVDNASVQIFHSDLSVTSMFGKANQWVAKSFNDYKSVIQYEDKDNYRLILKGSVALEKDLSRVLSFSMTFDCREEKYRVTIDALKITTNYNELEKEFSYSEYINASREDIFGLTDEDFESIRTQYENDMQVFEARKKKWRPDQFHYKSAQQAYESSHKKYLVALAAEETVNYIMGSREQSVKEQLATIFNNVSSFIAHEDTF